MNILTFDIEEWFHLLDNNSTRSEEQWKGLGVRIYEYMERIFRVFGYMERRDGIQTELQFLRMENVRMPNEKVSRESYARFLEEENRSVEKERHIAMG